MNKLIFVSVCLVVCTFAMPLEDPEEVKFIPIVQFSKEQSADGSFKSSYKTGNDINVSESGTLKHYPDGGNPVLSQAGDFSYINPDGDLVSVQYTADENGFHAVGDHIPKVAPPSPEIQKSLDKIYAGIKINQERAAARALKDPEFAKKLEEKAYADYHGHYYPLEI